MNLSVKDAAALLTVSEKTIYRWIKQDLIPVYKLNESYRFNKSELLEWALSRRMGVPVSAYEEPESRTLPLPSLVEALENGGVFYRIEGNSRNAVLKNMVRELRLPPETDRDYLEKALIARENLASTGLGQGIAVPHPRNPLPLHLNEPSLSLSFLEQPVDYQALDGQPVSVLFTLLSPTARMQLHLLSRLCFVLRDGGFQAALQQVATRENLFAALQQAEASLARTAP